MAFANWGLNWDGDRDEKELAKAHATIQALQAVEATPEVVVGSARADPVVASVDPSGGAESNPSIAVGLRDDPTATPLPTSTPVVITEYREVYINVPVEVTRIVEIASIPMPTVTPIPLAPGTIQVCASVEGARELYIGGAGVVSGGCQSFTFGVGQTSIQVQVNK